MNILEELQELYIAEKNLEKQVKAGDEADELNERVEQETGATRRILTSAIPNTTPPVSAVRLAHSYPSSYSRTRKDGFKDLERIRIPTFGGNKTKFQHWYATFNSFVDATSLCAQFKMLRSEACLSGEALETIQGLGY